jgi:hypothetical protein
VELLGENRMENLHNLVPNNNFLDVTLIAYATIGKIAK